MSSGFSINTGKDLVEIFAPYNSGTSVTTGYVDSSNNDLSKIFQPKTSAYSATATGFTISDNRDLSDIFEPYTFITISGANSYIQYTNTIINGYNVYQFTNKSASAVSYQNADCSFKFNVPKTVNVIIVGGGGSGGYGYWNYPNLTYSGGGGGAGGGITIGTLTCIQNTSYNLRVGSGGLQYTNRYSGQASYVSSLIANGGQQGSPPDANGNGNIGGINSTCTIDGTTSSIGGGGKGGSNTNSLVVTFGTKGTNGISYVTPYGTTLKLSGGGGGGAGTMDSNNGNGVGGNENIGGDGGIGSLGGIGTDRRSVINGRGYGAGGGGSLGLGNNVNFGALNIIGLGTNGIVILYYKL